MRFAVGYLILLLVLCSGRSALAQKIAVVVASDDVTIARRVEAELSALGFEVELVEEQPSVEPHTLRQLAASRRAVASLRASPSKTGIELWIADPNTGATAFEEVVTVETGRNDELLALRAVEVLRARLLKLGVVTKPAPSLSEPHESTTAWTDSSAVSSPEPRTGPPLLWADLGVAYIHQPGALTNYESLRLGLVFSPLQRWSLAGFALIPLQQAQVSSDVGEASIRANLFALAADGHWSQAWFRSSLGAGVALALLDVEGRADYPFEGQRDRLLSGLPFVRTGIAAALAERLLLHAELLAGLSMPRTIIRLGQEENASWGRPLVAGTLSLQLGVINGAR